MLVWAGGAPCGTAQSPLISSSTNIMKKHILTNWKSRQRYLEFAKFSTSPNFRLCQELTHLVSYQLQGGSLCDKKPELHILHTLNKLRELRQVCKENGISISTRHLPSMLDYWANDPSRKRNKYHRDLDGKAHRLIKRVIQRRLTLLKGHEASTLHTLQPIYSGTPQTVATPGVVLSSSRTPSRGIVMSELANKKRFLGAQKFAKCKQLEWPIMKPWKNFLLDFGRTKVPKLERNCLI